MQREKSALTPRSAGIARKSRFLAAILPMVVAVAAEPAAKAAERVNVVGCPRPGVEVNCLVIQGEDFASYDISSVVPRPQPNYRVIQLTGTKTKKVGICQQSIILSDVTWTYTDQPCQ